MAKFYGIGVGVGDPEMMTIKAVKALKKLDVVVLPEAKKDEGSTAYEIAKEYLKDGIETLFLEFPMIKDVEEKKKLRKKNAEIVEQYLEEGKSLGFLTIGDPMTYSTYAYILEYMEEKHEVETVPGVSSFADIASRLNLPLVLGDESLKIVSLHKSVDIRAEIEGADNIVFMKITRDFDKLKEILAETGNLENAVLVSNSGKESQKVFLNISETAREDIHYFSTLIIKKGGISQWKKFIS